ncbi:MAG: tRNA uridine-5-carboxymethylaminomethyl(34) synthesis GTPase MnmE [Robiginitomaculum sp.]|nr:MAG: tRNA uridine-5-carboxymethylaminomethyl(34) synthesis GTPase MnmE [Robiginitomaculum sp.]
MHKQETDTIFALSSARGSAGIAVLRLSGDQALGAANRLMDGKELVPRKTHLRWLTNPQTKEQLDQALVLYFAGPNSFTGEDVVELHCHGSMAVLDAVSSCLLDLGLRSAEPGEFTRRAFDNNRLDLLEAEGLADLIDSRTDAQRQQALGQMGGELSQQVEIWRSLLLAALARIEAEIDFPDEEDVSGSLVGQTEPGLAELQSLLLANLQQANRGTKVRDGYLIALLGPVNAGKSTLLNALAGEERAIVSAEPGTTRDIVEVQLQIGGFLVTIADSAGLRPSTDKIEIEGIRRAKKLAERADLRLFLNDGSKSDKAAGREFLSLAQEGDLFLRTKTDLLLDPKPAQQGEKTDELNVSAKTGTGLEQVLLQIETRVTQTLGKSEVPVLTRARHIDAVGRAEQAVQAARNELTKPDGAMPELVAEHLRDASQSLGYLVGRVHSEQILDEIFNGFCIGK